MTTARATTPAVHTFHQHKDINQDSMVRDGIRCGHLMFRSKQKTFTHKQSTLGKYINSRKSSTADLDQLGKKSDSLDKRLGAVRQGLNLGPAQTSATIGFTLSQFKGFRHAGNCKNGGPTEDQVRFEPHEIRTEEEVKRAVTWGI